MSRSFLALPSSKYLDPIPRTHFAGLDHLGHPTAAALDDRLELRVPHLQIPARHAHLCDFDQALPHAHPIARADLREIDPARRKVFADAAESQIDLMFGPEPVVEFLREDADRAV